MKIHNFWGDLIEVSAEKERLFVGSFQNQTIPVKREYFNIREYPLRGLDIPYCFKLLNQKHRKLAG